MKKIRLYYILLPIVVFIFGCSEDFLDRQNPTTVTTENFYKTENDFFLATMGVYNVLIRADLYNPTMEKLLEIRSDDANPGDDQNYVSVEGNAIDNFTEEATNFPSLNLWSANFIGVSRANTVITRVEQSELSDSLKDHFKAEAGFLRALFYFNLVRLFGDVPYLNKEVVSTSQLEIGRTDYKKIYDEIIVPDLIFASEKLPEEYIQSHKGRATKWAAKSLLAKVYLTMGSFDPTKFENAMNLAEEVVDQGPYSLEPYYPDLFRTNYENGVESIFEIQFVIGAGSGYKYEGFGDGVFRPQRQGEGSEFNVFFAPRFQGVTRANIGFSYDGYGFCTPTTSSEPRQGYQGVPPGTGIVECFSDADSIRKNATILDYRKAVLELGFDESNINENLSPYNINKYMDYTGSSNGEAEDNFYLIRLADILLVYAEAANEVNHGPTDKAYDYINRVRSRAKIDNLSEGLNYEQFLEAVYKERRLELAFEGNRWFDLIRRPEMGINIMKAHGKTNISQERLLMAIPQMVIDMSENRITQNPGYGNE